MRKGRSGVIQYSRKVLSPLTLTPALNLYFVIIITGGVVPKAG
jgi:hypothetical protein